MRTVGQILAALKAHVATLPTSTKPDVARDAVVMFCAAEFIHAVERCESRLEAIQGLLTKGKP